VGGRVRGREGERKGDPGREGEGERGREGEREADEESRGAKEMGGVPFCGKWAVISCWRHRPWLKE
jgi:hypothetical protein